MVLSLGGEFKSLRNLVGSFLLILAISVVGSGQAVTWTIDPDHSTAEFTVRHMLITNVKGVFDGPVGTVTFDPKDMLGSLKVQATLNAKSVHTRNAERDKDVKGDQFLAVNKYPTITFKSKKAEPAGNGKFKVTGDLTIRGVTKEVLLDVEGPTAPIIDLWKQVRVGATMTTTVSRKAFGLTYNELLETGGAVVSDEVRISIDIEIFHKE